MDLLGNFHTGVGTAARNVCILTFLLVFAAVLVWVLNDVRKWKQNYPGRTPPTVREWLGALVGCTLSIGLFVTFMAGLSTLGNRNYNAYQVAKYLHSEYGLVVLDGVTMEGTYAVARAVDAANDVVWVTVNWGGEPTLPDIDIDTSDVVTVQVTEQRPPVG